MTGARCDDHVFSFDFYYFTIIFHGTGLGAIELCPTLN